MYHQGHYKLLNPTKYIGNIGQITFRSGWELAVMRWADRNEKIVKWGSETVKIKYVCSTDMKSNKTHMYFIDFIFYLKDVKTPFLIEIKPRSQVMKPVRKSLKESLTYMKNTSKWKYATEFAQKNGMVFQVWTEDTLKNMGILNG